MSGTMLMLLRLSIYPVANTTGKTTYYFSDAPSSTSLYWCHLDIVSETSKFFLWPSCNHAKLIGITSKFVSHKVIIQKRLPLCEYNALFYYCRYHINPAQFAQRSQNISTAIAFMIDEEQLPIVNIGEPIGVIHTILIYHNGQVTHCPTIHVSFCIRPCMCTWLHHGYQL